MPSLWLSIKIKTLVFGIKSCLSGLVSMGLSLGLRWDLWLSASEPSKLTFFPPRLNISPSKSLSPHLTELRWVGTLNCWSLSSDKADQVGSMASVQELSGECCALESRR